MRHDAGAGARRAKLVQLLATQAFVAVVALAFAYLSRDQPRTLGLSLWTLVVPAGFAYAYLDAHRRSEAARRADAWTPQMEAAIAKRLVARLGLALMAWIAGLAGIWYLVG